MFDLERFIYLSRSRGLLTNEEIKEFDLYMGVLGHPSVYENRSPYLHLINNYLENLITFDAFCQKFLETHSADVEKTVTLVQSILEGTTPIFFPNSSERSYLGEIILEVVSNIKIYQNKKAKGTSVEELLIEEKKVSGQLAWSYLKGIIERMNERS